MIDVIPFGSGLLIKLLFLHICNYTLTVGFDQVIKSVIWSLSQFFTVIHLVLDNDLLFK